MRKIFSASAAAALTFGLAGCAATPALAVEAPACESGVTVDSIVGSLRLVADREDLLAAGPASTGILTSGGCQVGTTTPVRDDSPRAYGDAVLIQLPSGAQGWAKSQDVAVYAEVDPSQLTDFFAVGAEDHSGGLLGAVARSSRNAHFSPGVPISSQQQAAALELNPGQVLRSSADPALQVLGKNRFEDTLFQPVENPQTPGQVLWVDAVALLALPAVSDPRQSFTAPDGWSLYAEPTDPTPKRVIKEGEKFDATAEVAGWRYSEDGWLRSPAGTVVEKEETGPSAWEKAKEKGKDLLEAGKEKVSEKIKETPKAAQSTLDTPAAVTALVLAALALVLALLPARRPRGLRALTPQGWVLAILGLVAAPASFGLAVAAAGVAPWSWVWLPWASLGVSLVSAAALAGYARKMRGGAAPQTLAELKTAAFKPLPIGAGLLVTGTGIGAVIWFGLAPLALAPAVLGGVATFAALALAGGTKPVEATDPGPAEPTPEANDPAPNTEEVKQP